MTIDLPVVVLCGGLGTRLRSAVSDRPKALAPVGNEPFLAVQLDLLRQRGARRFVLCVGHMADQIEAEFGDGSRFGVRIDYSHDGEKLLGTGGALKRAERFFAPAAVVVNGDTYIDVDLHQLAHTHASARTRWHDTGATLTLARMPDASRYGSIDTDGTRVRAFREKETGAAQSGWVNAGVYVIERDLLARIPADEVVSLERDVFPAALRDGLTLAAFSQDAGFHDIGTPDDFRGFVAQRETIHVA
ncbi:D-glycero-alpha-D-manno-heptose 1-phosphate guanylyltransferase [Gemmata sp. SH-PL17]|uniref:nucleotidyltransferase family protein n=1 Tax=Gemmata sp. SH-PL17 TaxID=1630693 RepID=UPI0004B4404E|nr:nucleotidyltransferase family protein [Gemmata sp. SH-PL17]AMV28222.1 D-glycero-alpha-D-manno-heptose 1-phosphate guanylyltransferase [Gemmata sp. SH-PL17]